MPRPAHRTPSEGCLSGQPVRPPVKIFAGLGNTVDASHVSPFRTPQTRIDNMLVPLEALTPARLLRRKGGKNGFQVSLLTVQSSKGSGALQRQITAPPEAQR